MKITIIGAGNTAVAAACFLKTLGLSSLIYTRREERAKQWNQFPVKASGACTGSFSLESTTDLKTAVHYGDILLVCTLAADHETVISEIAPTCRRTSPFSFQRLLGASKHTTPFQKTGYAL